MSDEQTLDPKEISRRIIVGVGLVYDVLNELDGLLRMILEELKSSLEFDDIKGKFFRMPVPRGRARTAADTSMPLDRGFVLELGVAGDEDEDEDDEEEEIGGEEDEEAANDKRGLQISPDSQFLAVRAILYDRDAVKHGGFEPVVVAATMANMKRVPKGKLAKKKEEETSFLARRGHLLQLAKALDGHASEGQRLAFRTGGYELVGMVAKVVSRRLAEFDSEDKVSTFVEEMVRIAEPATE